MRQFRAMSLRGQFRFLARGNVVRASDVPEKRPFRRTARHALVRNPAVFTVVASQAVLHCELSSRVECIRVGCETAPAIVGMNTLCPAVAEFLVERASGEIEPALVEKRTELVRARHPDEHRGSIGHRAEPRL